MRAIAIVFLCLLAGCHGRLNGGDELRNGGDPVAKRIEAGRDKARRILDAVENLAPQDLPVDGDALKKFYSIHRAELRDDVAASPHEWAPRNANGACGATSTTRNAKIVFSYSQCDGVKLEIDAALQLIGESVHHMGIASDSFTAALAVGVGRAWVRYLSGLPAGANRRFLFEEARAFLVGILRHLASNGSRLGNLAELSAALDNERHEWRDELADDECARKIDDAGLVALSHAACDAHSRAAAARALLAAELRARKGITLEAAMRLAEQIFTEWRERGFSEGTQLVSLPPPAPKKPEFNLEQAPVVWTGREAITWGATAERSDVLQIARFNPAKEKWSFSYGSRVPAEWYRASYPRLPHNEVAVYAGGAIVVISDCHATTRARGLGQFLDETTRKWVALDAPEGWRERMGASVVAMGDRLAILGGRACDGPAVLGDSAIYSFQAKAWKKVPAHPALEKSGFVTTKVDGKLFVWGPGGGAIFDPIAGAFRDLPKAGAPGSRSRALAVAFGREVLVFGGYDEQMNYLPTGAVYDVDTRKWRAVATESAPTEMPALVVAAGPNLAFLGAETTFYNSLRNVWTPVPHAYVPEARAAFWNGGQILLWQGTNNFAIYP